MMKRSVADNPQSMAARVADRLEECLRSIPQPLFCPASGDTPAALYAELVRRTAAHTLDTSGWYFVGLDEWVGMNGADEGSCRYYIDKGLFQPLQVSDERICFFDGRAADLQKECDRVERFISNRGRIDVAILGIGPNGHVAMNEPGADPSGRSHVSILHPATRATGQKYFRSNVPLERGITLGLGTLLDAHYLFLLATGEHKAAIVTSALEGPVTSEVPASLLRNHPNLEVWLDAGAASLLNA
ncbi:MAG TPA: glucosamine-6-phosphate deaminase [Puia sp.]|nr:glucosamine-6-phosphate deaminase [Puia sp.]